MAKYRVFWTEESWWETFVEANSKEEAIEKVDEWTEEVTDNMRECDDGFIQRSDADAELVVVDDFDDPRDDPAIADSIEDMAQEEKAFPSDKE